MLDDAIDSRFAAASSKCRGRLDKHDSAVSDEFTEIFAGSIGVYSAGLVPKMSASDREFACVVREVTADLHDNFLAIHINLVSHEC